MRARRSCKRKPCTCFRRTAESRERSVSSCTSGCSGPSSTNVAPKMVSMRVVKTSICVDGSPSSANLTRAPSERPIQLRCIVSTFSGHLLRPSAAVEQLVGIGGDAEEPLLQIARLDLRAAPPAAAVHHLLVGQYRLVHRAPVDRRLPPVGQALLEHPDEEPLVPLVVLGVAGRQLAFPRVADAQPLELALHVGDVGAGGLLGMDPALDRGVLRRQAERIPPERVQDVEALHPLGARHHVADDVVADVADVRVARRIREHLQAVELRARRVDGDLEGAAFAPVRLPLAVECLGTIVGHWWTVDAGSGLDSRLWESQDQTEPRTKTGEANYSRQCVASPGRTAAIVASARGAGPSGRAKSPRSASPASTRATAVAESRSAARS